MAILDVPDWIQEYVDKWKAKLHLTQWRIRVNMSLAPMDSTRTAACCSQVQNIAEATLTFRADAEDTPDWRETVLHEILHISHGQVDQAVWNVALDGMPQAERSKAYEAYSDAMEKFVDGMSKILYQMEQEIAAAQSSQETNHVQEAKPEPERRRIGFATGRIADARGRSEVSCNLRRG